MKRYGSIVRPDPAVAAVALVVGLVVPIVFGLAVPTDTAPVVGLAIANFGEPVPIAVPELTETAGVAEPGIFDVVLVAVGDVPVLVAVVDPIELVSALTLAVFVPWLLVLPTWPVFSFGLT